MSKIIFSESGQGFPVIFLHGFCESKELWLSFEQRLSKNFRVLAPDLPGFGQSPLERESFSLEDIADDLDEWLDGAGVKECIMIGHSMGGYVTLAYAKKYGARLKGLGLFHSTAFADSEEKKAHRAKTIEFIRKNGVKPFVENFFPALVYKENQERLMPAIQQWIERAKKIPEDVIVRYLAAMRDRPDSAAFIKEFDKPALMIIGEHDGSVPYEKSMQQAEMLKHPHVHVLTYTGHMGMLESEKETLEFVEAFALSTAAGNGM